MSGWTKEMDERLKARWLAGESASAIGDGIGRSRSAVLGRIHRLGLQRAPATALESRLAASMAVKVADRKARTPGPPKVAATGGWSLSTEATARPPRPIPVSDGTDQAIGLMALTLTTCRWPVGATTGADQLFCGGPAPETHPYCGHHARLGSGGKPAGAVG